MKKKKITRERAAPNCIALAAWFDNYTFYKRGTQCNTVLRYLIVKLSTSNSTFGSTNAFTGFTFATNFHIVLARTFPVCSSEFSCLSLCRRVNLMRSRLLENEAVYQLQHFPSTVTSPMSPVASHSLLTFRCGMFSNLFSYSSPCFLRGPS